MSLLILFFVVFSVVKAVYISEDLNRMCLFAVVMSVTVCAASMFSPDNGGGKCF